MGHDPKNSKRDYKNLQELVTAQNKRTIWNVAEYFQDVGSASAT